MEHETVSDDLFGLLTWDYQFHLWRGHAKTTRGLDFDLWLSTGIEDIVPPIEDNKIVREISAESREAFVRVCNSEQCGREGLVARFVPLHADWHGEQIAPTDFQKRLRLSSIHIDRDGTIQIFYSDDGMFGGHSLIAHLDPSGVFMHGEMFG